MAEAHKLTVYIPEEYGVGVDVVGLVTRALSAKALSCAVVWEALVPFDMRDR